MLELLFLLLPVAAAYGWYMGRRSAQQNKQDEANRLSRDYVAGVNFLLSNQQDKAVDLFLDMLKEDTGTVEAHLTLGNLFRSRGEVDRAIRIHQTLMESASLTYEQRLLAIQQLGRDYMAAGACLVIALGGQVEFQFRVVRFIKRSLQTHLQRVTSCRRVLRDILQIEIAENTQLRKAFLDTRLPILAV